MLRLNCASLLTGFCRNMNDWAKLMNNFNGGAASAAPSPPGIIEAVRAAMAVHADVYSGARQAKIGRNSYRTIKRLLDLHKSHNINDQQRAALDEVFKKIDTERYISQQTLNIIDRNFTEKKLSRANNAKRQDKSAEKKKNLRLDRTLISISETCDSMKDMILPADLSPEKTREAIETLAISQELIAKLMRRLLGAEDV